MIDGLIGGKLHGKPVQRKGNNGNLFVTAKVRTVTGENDAVFVNVITFTEEVCNSLLALDNGDSVALIGTLTPKVWQPPQGEPRPSLDMLATGITTPYNVARKRQAASSPSKSVKAHHSRRVAAADGLDSDLPWDR